MMMLSSTELAPVDLDLLLDDEATMSELEIFSGKYPQLSVIEKQKQHCTSCNKHLGTALTNVANIRLHPVLKVTVCKQCYEFYNSGEFDRGEDGSELYCRWCGQGGKVYCCSKCVYVFCKACIKSNFSNSMWRNIEKSDTWECFRCNFPIMIDLRAKHHAFINYLKNKQNYINTVARNEKEIRSMMKFDENSCCSGKKDYTVQKKRPLEAADSDEEPLIKRATPKSRKVKLKADKEDDEDDSISARLTELSCQNGQDSEMVCTPDIMSLMTPIVQLNEENNDEENHEDSSAKVSPSSSPPMPMLQQQLNSNPIRLSAKPLSDLMPLAVNASRPTQPPPLQMNNQTSSRPKPRNPAPPKPRMPTTQTTSRPLYHTINGFRIDLETASKHECFRLPNGKLIQVRRQNTSTKNPPIQPQPQPPVPIVNSGIRIESRPAQPRPPIIQQPQTAPQFPQSFPIIQQRPIVQTPITTQYLSMPTGMGIRMNFTNNNQIITAPTITPPMPQHQQQPQIMLHNPTIQQSGQRMFTIQQPAPQQTAPQQQMVMVMNQQPPPLVMVPPSAYPESPVGKAQTSLLHFITTGKEAASHVAQKLLMFINSNAYKNMKTLADVRDLHIDLSFLFSYAMSRFNTLQEDVQNMIEKLKKDLEDSQKLNDPQGTEDDLELLEERPELISLDSDEEKETPKKAKISPPVRINILSKQRPIAPKSAAAKQLNMTPSVSQTTPTRNIIIKPVTTTTVVNTANATPKTTIPLTKIQLNNADMMKKLNVIRKTVNLEVKSPSEVVNTNLNTSKTATVNKSSASTLKISKITCAKDTSTEEQDPLAISSVDSLVVDKVDSPFALEITHIESLGEDDPPTEGPVEGQTNDPLAISTNKEAVNGETPEEEQELNTSDQHLSNMFTNEGEDFPLKISEIISLDTDEQENYEVIDITDEIDQLNEKSNNKEDQNSKEIVQENEKEDKNTSNTEKEDSEAPKKSAEIGQGDNQENPNPKSDKNEENLEERIEEKESESPVEQSIEIENVIIQDVEEESGKKDEEDPLQAEIVDIFADCEPKTDENEKSEEDNEKSSNSSEKNETTNDVLENEDVSEEKTGKIDKDTENDDQSLSSSDKKESTTDVVENMEISEEKTPENGKETQVSKTTNDKKEVAKTSEDMTNKESNTQKEKEKAQENNVEGDTDVILETEDPLATQENGIAEDIEMKPVEDSDKIKNGIDEEKMDVDDSSCKKNKSEINSDNKDEEMNSKEEDPLKDDRIKDSNNEIPDTEVVLEKDSNLSSHKSDAQKDSTEKICTVANES